MKQGREALLLELIQKKLSREKTIPEIADEPEESDAEIKRLINTPPNTNIPTIDKDYDPLGFPGS